MDTEPLEHWLVTEARGVRLRLRQIGTEWIAEYQMPGGEIFLGSGSTRDESIGLVFVKAGGPRDPKYGFRLLGRDPLMCYLCGGTLFERYVQDGDVSEFVLRRQEAGIQWRQPIGPNSVAGVWSAAGGKVLCVGCRNGKVKASGLLVYDLEQDGDVANDV